MERFLLYKLIFSKSYRNDREQIALANLACQVTSPGDRVRHILKPLVIILSILCHYTRLGAIKSQYKPKRR